MAQASSSLAHQSFRGPCRQALQLPMDERYWDSWVLVDQDGFGLLFPLEQTPNLESRGAWETRTKRTSESQEVWRGLRGTQGCCIPGVMCAGAVGKRIFRRMETAWRCSCVGAGEGVSSPYSGWPGKSCLDAVDEVRVAQAGLRLASHGTRSALVRGEPLNAFTKLCTLHLATTGMKRRGYLFPCP